MIAVGLARRVRGALILGIFLATLFALVLGVTHRPQGAWIGLPDFSIVGAADLASALRLAFLPLLVSVVMVDFFDTLGTVTAIADEAGLHDPAGRVPALRRILAVDSISASVGGFFGVSSVTSYIESAAGVAEGARTGLHSVIVGLLFALSVFAAPIAAVVPAAATAPALIVVGFLMAQQITRIEFARLDTAVPAFVLLVMIPFTYSISHGIGLGFLTYIAIKLLAGRAREVHPIMYGVGAAFGAYFALA
jgi:AGZA family xanthine/uracil permease-like MFS transporter